MNTIFRHITSGFSLFILVFYPAFAQQPVDSLLKIHSQRLDKFEDSLKQLRIRFNNLHSDLALTGTRLIGNDEDTPGGGAITISGYAAAYYGHYSDTSGPSGYQKFPTASPRKNDFGLDMAMISAQYKYDGLRAIIRLHWGDIASSAWSREYNLIQEANAGIRLAKKWWFDMGFFRTHLGLESIQPRENICQSISLVTYFEPYYLSGAKLSFLASDKIKFQMQVFNGFNGFVETNRKKAVGLSVLYEPNQKWTLTSNLLYDDPSANGQKAQPLLYWNTYSTYKTDRWLIGSEFNIGVQHSPAKISGNSDQNTKSVLSVLLSARYMLNKSLFTYGRIDFFRDPDEMLTGPLVNENHQLVGLEAEGVTLGIEFCPTSNSQFRLETRGVHTKQDEKIFSWNNNRASIYRLELLAGLGVWF